MKLVVIATTDQEDLLKLKKYNLESVGYLEIRLDLLPAEFIQKKLPNILNAANKNYIFTYRKPEDSSIQNSSLLVYKDIEKVLVEFNNKKNFLDIELNHPDSIFHSLENSKYSIIHSYHNFQKSISLKEMQSYIKKVKSPSKNSVFKFAVKPQTIEEIADFYSSIKTLSATYKMIGIAMGELGVIGRVFAERYGSSYTYCCLSKPKAPGQVSVDTLLKLKK